METFWNVLLGICGGGALFGFIQFLIQRRDNNILKVIQDVDKKLDDFKKDFEDRLDELRREMQDESANDARIRILKFSEEEQRGQRHTKESFVQVHKDIDDYVAHCTAYPDYPNSRAEAASKNIAKLYQEYLEKERNGEEGFLP